ncbi:LLM class flavin-dependent oxidoreductase [Myceligenerans indicum]|uniref:LLM class flavin-dependent oxidoreductase n=1 Tax=Myceligenerans indicum TaxID=2593663 RepID=A0ABS1LQV8_9MICO|nr:LLM class flavin-dependent oxidoreductase [Myceligenerans indicum]MBL0888469.1 LLM class flavin-dependent oxidoreductase [Myceligenerans indicum]
MKFGFIGSFGTPEQHVTLARECEEHGWDGFFTWDAISLGPFGPTWDPFSVLAAAAAVTDRITLGAMVFALPRHRPWELAQRALTVDHLSGGRLVLPVGVGVLDDGGFASVPGQPTDLKERARLLDDVLAYLDEAWKGEPFTFDGAHVRAGEMVFPERPVNGRIPVWPVGTWDSHRPPVRNLARTLRWDGIVTQNRGSADEPGPASVAGLTRWLHSQPAWAERDPQRPFDVVAQGKLSEDPVEAAEQARAMRDAGATWWIDSWWDPDTVTPELLLEKVRQGPPVM